MPFNQYKFDRSFNQTRGIFDKFVYITSDSVDDVLVPGYFSEVRFGDEEITNGLVEAECSDGTVIFKILSRDSVEVIFDSSKKYTSGGFMDYNDTSTAASPLALVADTWTTIPNDGLGAFTNKAYAPFGVTELMDTSTGAIDPTQLSLGDDIIIRNDFRVNPNVNNALLKFRYQLGAGADVYELETNLGRLDDGSGKDYPFSLTTDYIYMGDLNTLNNPIFLQVNLSTDGTLTNAGSVIKASRGV